jgi:uncharacterized RDD family membrane protein YckC
VRDTFETSSGTVEVVVDEESRTVSAYRFNAEGRAVAAAMESWDYADLADVLARKLGVSALEADDIAAQVRANVQLGAMPQPPQQLPSRHSASSYLDTVGIPLRFVAVLLDAFIVLLPLSIAIGLLSGGGYSESGNGYARAGVNVTGNAVWLLLAFALGYYIFCEAATGMTLGKRMVGIRVVGEEGEELTLGAATVRNLLRPIDGLFFYLVGAVFALASSRRQRLGDRVAHTLVIRR